MWSFRKFIVLEQFWRGAFVNCICLRNFGVELSSILLFGIIMVWSFRKFYMLEQFWCGAFVNFIVWSDFGVELSQI